ncbi:MAG: hypothetical protein IM638_03270 [Bacteroidetes bacterium]|nr:hypothetical protein [Bacteroidota bacterium]
MNYIFRIMVLLLLCLPGIHAKAQCDQVYTPGQTGCEYAPGHDSLMKFMKQHLLPVLQKLPAAEKQHITKLLVVMTVDAQGTITDIRLPYFNGPAATAQELKNKIATMKGWTTGKLNGQPVCTEVFWGMNCVMWE